MEELLRMRRGREFQVVGAATAKLREPKHVRTRGTCPLIIQCFDAVAWMRGMVSRPYKLTSTLIIMGATGQPTNQQFIFRNVTQIAMRTLQTTVEGYQRSHTAQ